VLLEARKGLQGTSADRARHTKLCELAESVLEVLEGPAACGTSEPVPEG